MVSPAVFSGRDLHVWNCCVVQERIVKVQTIVAEEEYGGEETRAGKDRKVSSLGVTHRVISVKSAASNLCGARRWLNVTQYFQNAAKEHIGLASKLYFQNIIFNLSLFATYFLTSQQK